MLWRGMTKSMNLTKIVFNTDWIKIVRKRTTCRFDLERRVQTERLRAGELWILSVIFTLKEASHLNEQIGGLSSTKHHVRVRCMTFSVSLLMHSSERMGDFNISKSVCCRAPAGDSKCNLEKLETSERLSAFSRIRT